MAARLLSLLALCVVTHANGFAPSTTTVSGNAANSSLKSYVPQSLTEAEYKRIKKTKLQKNKWKSLRAALGVDRLKGRTNKTWQEAYGKRLMEHSIVSLGYQDRDEVLSDIAVKIDSSPMPVADPSKHVPEKSRLNRLKSAIPGLHGLRSSYEVDHMILKTASPAMMNLAVVPIVATIETMWIGRLGDALALAGQSAANTMFLTAFYFVSFLPTMVAPMVATAVGSGRKDEARKKTCETLFLSLLLGTIGTTLLFVFPRIALLASLKSNAPAMDYAAPYLRSRCLSMIPALVSATGFAVYRGMLDTVTPLKISFVSSVAKLVLDPILIFRSTFGFVGATMATLVAETCSSCVYIRLLLKNKLASVSAAVLPPSLQELLPLLSNGFSMMIRQIAINVAMLTSGRCAQGIDMTGISGAAYGIAMQMYTIGFVVHVAMQGAAAALVPATLAKEGPNNARNVGDRLYAWSVLTGLFLASLQYVLLPKLVPLFSSLREVQEAVKAPALIACILHAVNGPRFAGEGILMGLKEFRVLSGITVIGVGMLVGVLRTPLGSSTTGIMWANLIFCMYQTVATAVHYLRFGRLAVPRETSQQPVSSIHY